MEDNDLRVLESLFAQVEDPRMERTKRHRLRDIIILAICGAEGWVDIEEFGKAKEAFFTDLLDLSNGIPSHDTFGRVFALIDPKQFEASFVQWGSPFWNKVLQRPLHKTRPSVFLLVLRQVLVAQR